MEKITVRVPKDLKEQITTEAKKQGLTMNALVLSILWAWIKQNKEK